jgi:hypothetical protein
LVSKNEYDKLDNLATVLLFEMDREDEGTSWVGPKTKGLNIPLFGVWSLKK